MEIPCQFNGSFTEKPLVQWDDGGHMTYPIRRLNPQVELSQRPFLASAGPNLTWPKIHHFGPF